MRKYYLLLFFLFCSFFSFSQDTIFYEGFENVTTYSYTSSAKSINGLTGWEYIQSKNTTGRLRFNAGIGFYHSGSFAATMDGSIYPLNQLIKTVELKDYRYSKDVVLSFYMMGHGESLHGYDKLAIQVDTSSNIWYDIYDLEAYSAGIWRHFKIDIDSALKVHNVSLSSTIRLRFSQYDNNYASSTSKSGGLTFDDITLTGTGLRGVSVGLHSIIDSNLWHSGNQTLKIRYQNRGKDTIRYLGFGYKMNDTVVSYDSVAITPLASHEVDTYVFLKKINILKNKNNLSVWVYKPNGMLIDYNTEDDTLRTLVYPTLTDTYYIDINGNGDFEHFNDAINAIELGGMSGDVVFVVREGLYEEQVTIPRIKGADSNARLVIVGENKEKSIISYCDYAPDSARGTFIFDGTENITIKSLTIKSEEGDQGTVAVFTNDSRNMVIEDCILKSKLSKISSESICINATASLSDYNKSGRTASNVILKNNLFIGGRYAIHWCGYHQDSNQNLQIIDNLFENQFRGGIYLQDVGNTNIISNSFGGLVSDDGQMIIGVNTSLDTIMNNFMNPANVGIELIKHNMSYELNTQPKSIIANNIITEFENKYYNIGIELNDKCNNLDIIHNSIRCDGRLNQYAKNSVIYIHDSVQNVSVKNNLMIAGSNTYNLSIERCSDLSIDYNNYIYPRSSLNNHFYLNTAYKNFSNFKSDSTYFSHDLNSYDNKEFHIVSKDDLHMDLLKQNTLTGTALGLNIDIDGELRDLMNPIIGADEYPYPKKNLVLVGIDSPSDWQLNQNHVTVSIQNLGQDSINYYGIALELNDTILFKNDSVPISGYLTSNIIQYCFPTSINLNTGKNSLKVWVHNPNGNNINTLTHDDTIAINLFAPFGDTIFVNQQGTGDFTSVSAAIDAVENYGISKKMIILVQEGIYEERIKIDEIPGASKTNTLTILGENVETTRIVFSGSRLNEFSTIDFNGCDYIILKNISVENPGPSIATGISFHNEANFNTIESCKISVASKTSYYFCAIYGESSDTMVCGIHNSFINNEIIGGSVGILYDGENLDTAAHLNFISNTFKSQSEYALNIRDLWNSNIIGNQMIKFASNKGTGIALSGTYMDTVVNNLINPGYIGINISDHNGNDYAYSPIRSLIANNMICDFIKRDENIGFVINGGVYNLNVYHNSIEAGGDDNSNLKSVVFKITSNSGYIDIKNNIFKALDNAYVFAIQYFSCSNIDVDYNNYIYPTKDYRFYLTKNLRNLTAFKVVGSVLGSHDDNSYDNSIVHFKSEDDLHLSPFDTLNLTGANLGLTYDFDNHVRDITAPTLGADQQFLKDLNLALISVDSPIVFTKDFKNFKVTLQNRGNVPITKISIGYQLNDNPTVTIKNIQVNKLNTIDTLKYLLINQYKLKNGANTLKVWCGEPNGCFVDSNLTDDTLIATIYPSMADTYSIDPGGNGDFLSFRQATDALEKHGINKDVTFLVGTGIYNERVEIPFIRRANINSKINFIGKDKLNTVITQYSFIKSHSATLVLDSASNIYFNNITVRYEGDYYGIGVLLCHGANSIVFDDCNVDGNYPRASYYLRGVLCSDDESTYTNEQTSCSNITFKNCNIIGGYYGIQLSSLNAVSNANFLIENNDFENQFLSAIQVAYAQGTQITGNRLKKAVRGIELEETSLDTIQNNYINPSALGIYIKDSKGGYPFDKPRQHSLIANNIIGNFGNDDANLGIIIGVLRNPIKIIHNTISVRGYDTYAPKNSGIKVQNARYEVIIRNNIIEARDHSYLIALSLNGSYDIDYNAYIYNKQKGILKFHLEDEYMDFDEYLAAKVFFRHDDHSYDNIDPYFVSKDDFHLNPEKRNALYGQALGLQYDIDGELRGGGCPTLGADEYFFEGLDASITRIDSPLMFKKGETNIKVTIQNSGLDTINYFNIGYQVNKDSVVEIDSIKIFPLISRGFINYTIPYKIKLNDSVNNLKVWVTKPNGIYPDFQKMNDTLSVQIYSSMIDTYYIDSAGKGDYLTFKEAIDDIDIRGLAGPTVVIVRQGTYEENIMLRKYKNASSQNTLTFKGADGDRALLTYESDLNSTRSTVYLNGINHLTIDNLYIENTASYWATGILFTKQADSNTIQNCHIELSSPSTGYLNVILSSSDDEKSNGAGENGSHLLIKNNVIKGGFHSINLNGPAEDSSTYISIIGNKIRNSYGWGIKALYAGHLKIISNEIKTRSGVSSTGIEIYRSHLDTIVGNIIEPGAIGLRIEQQNRNAFFNQPNESFIANNLIANFKYSYYNFGIQLMSCNKTKIYHNTVSVDGGNTPYYDSRGLSIGSNSEQLSVYNNIFEAGSYSYLIYSGNIPVSIDYNAYIYPVDSTKNRFNISDEPYHDFIDYRNDTTIGIHDLHSVVNKAPGFVSGTNKRLKSDGFNKTLRGKNVGVIYDIDKDLRCISYPCLGADEIHNSNSINCSDSILDFGRTLTHTIVSDSFYISNHLCKTDTLKIYGIKATNSAFVIVEDSFEVWPFASEKVHVSFKPLIGGEYNDSLLVYSNMDTLSIRLIGDCLKWPGVLSDTLNTIQISACNSVKTDSVMLYNKSKNDYKINQFKIQYLDTSVNYSWLNVRCIDSNLLTYDSLKINLEYNDSGLYAGSYGAKIDIELNDSFNSIIYLYCKLVVQTKPHIVLSVNSIDFDSVSINTKAIKSVNIINNSCDSLHIYSISNSHKEFSFSINDIHIGAYQQTSLTIEFTPSSIKRYDDTIWIQSNDQTIYLKIGGTGAVGPKVNLNTDTINLTLAACDTSVIETFEIANLGDLDLNIYHDTTGIPSWINYILYKNTLQPLDTQLVVIQFNTKNRQPGIYKYPLSINTNDSNKKQVTVNLILEVIDQYYDHQLLGSDTSICPNSVYMLNALKLYDSYLWPDSSKNSFINVKSAGNYLLTAFDKNGCEFVDSIYVGFYNQPKANFTINDSTQCFKDQFFEFNNISSVQDDTIKSLHWIIEDKDIYDSSQVLYVFSTFNKFNIRLIVSTGHNCYDSIEKQIIVYKNPIIKIGTDTNLCPDRSIKLRVDSIYRSYLWSTLNTTPFTSYTNSSYTDQIITIEVTDSHGCKGSDTVIVYHNNDCVYPGDANADGVVDNKDVLYIGIKYNKTGSQRPDASILWRAEYATGWNDTIVGGTDIKHIDTDGDGIIDNNDTLAISTNYGKTRSGSKNGRGTDPPFYFDMPDTLIVGEKVSIPIMLGSNTKQVNEFYGVAFEIEDLNGIIQDQKIDLDFSSSWTGTEGNDLLIFNKDYNVSIVRTDQQNKSGFGQIGEITFTVNPDLEGNKEYSLTISNQYAISKEEKEQPLYATTDTVFVASGVENEQFHSYFDFKVYPNPNNGVFVVKIENINNEELSLYLYNSQGKLVFHEGIEPERSFVEKEFDLDGISKGIYFIKVQSKSGYDIKKLVVK